MIKVRLILGVFLALVVSLSVMPSYSQENSSPVVILVVDAFAIPEEPVSTTDLVESNNHCITPIDGQDSYLYDGSSGIDLRPFSVTHGDLVYGEVIYQINTQLGVSVPSNTTNGVSLFGAQAEWMHKIEYWDTQFGQIITVAVDTNGYDTGDIRDNIVSSFDLFSAQGFSHFVINMSFALIPCNRLVDLTVADYLDTLDRMIQTDFAQGDFDVEDLEDLRQILEDMVSQIPPGQLQETNEILKTLGEKEFLFLRQFVWMTKGIPRLRDSLRVAYGVNEEGESPLDRFDNCRNFQSLNIPEYAQLANDPLFQLFGILQPPSFQNNPQALGCYTYHESFLTNETLTDLRNDIENGRLVAIPVAASGNDGYDFPYAPAIWPSVVAASASYDNLPSSCPDVTTQFVAANASTFIDDENGDGNIDNETEVALDYLMNPRSNDGEVQMDGLLRSYINNPALAASPESCVWGTSFAAPKLSFEMALHLLNVGTVACNQTIVRASGQTTTVLLSAPPLAHMGWDNLQLPDAVAAHCPDF